MRHYTEVISENAALNWDSTKQQAKQLVVPEVTTFPMEDVGLAHAAIESCQTRGKLVLLAP
jgi:hypothetical protein